MDEKETSTPAEGAAAGKFNKARDYVGEKYAAASDAMKNTYGQVKDKVDDIDFEDLAEKGRAYVRSNPGKALLISIGVGFLIGLLLRRSDED